jgi:hypothetical protein
MLRSWVSITSVNKYLRGERTAQALESNLTSLEKKIDDLLASKDNLDLSLYQITRKSSTSESSRFQYSTEMMHIQAPSLLSVSRVANTFKDLLQSKISTLEKFGTQGRLKFPQQINQVILTPRFHRLRRVRMPKGWRGEFETCRSRFFEGRWRQWRETSRKPGKIDWASLLRGDLPMSSSLGTY